MDNGRPQPHQRRSQARRTTDGAVALVVVSRRYALGRAYRQRRLRSIQDLEVRLFIPRTAPARPSRQHPLDLIVTICLSRPAARRKAPRTAARRSPHAATQPPARHPRLTSCLRVTGTLRRAHDNSGSQCVADKFPQPRCATTSPLYLPYTCRRPTERCARTSAHHPAASPSMSTRARCTSHSASRTRDRLSDQLALHWEGSGDRSAAKITRRAFVSASRARLVELPSHRTCEN